MNLIGVTKRRPDFKAGVLLVAITLVGILAYRQVYRLTATPVWIAGTALAPGALVGPEDLKLLYQRGKSLAEGALLDRGAIEGKILRRPKAPGTPFFNQDFAGRPPSAPPTPLATLVPEGRVLTTLKIAQLSVPYTQLRMGDRLELVAVGGTGAAAEARVIARDAFLIGSVAPGNRPPAAAKSSRLGVNLSPPTRQTKNAGGLALILALHPGNVLAVAEARSSEASITVVLHGHHEVQEGKLLELEAAGPRAIELIAGARREHVSFPP